jgi:hypothetical protein
MIWNHLALDKNSGSAKLYNKTFLLKLVIILYISLDQHTIDKNPGTANLYLY